MDSSSVRKKFIRYFKDRGHEVVKSSSLIPRDDPSLLFTNAGMVPFKNLYLGIEKRSYTRAVSSQKCVRAGGKHNDLEQVGFTNRHHTFFEMLGNFSFGDYFKKEAIEMAWELLTDGYGLSPEKLWVSIYKDDNEAYEIWTKDVGVPDNRVVRLGEKDNFWSMGETGPCGPCSEIYIDQGSGIGCGKPTCGVGCDCDRYLEIWNLVFTQYDRQIDGSLVPLPKPNIDTGMGLERLSAILQGVYSNYDSDLFSDIINLTEVLAEKGYGEDKKRDISFKVIADHSRAAAFLIAEGIIPSNEGRGYVLRRIIRRAIRYGQILGMKNPFLHRLTDKVIDIMGSEYQELNQSRRFIDEVVINEEKRFADTLFHGLSLLREEIEKLRGEDKSIIPGELVFRLYDTFGFPSDLVEEIAREEGVTVDIEGFEKAMAEQRSLSQKSWKGSGEEEIPEIYRRLDSRGIKCEFLGYEALSNNSSITAILKHEGVNGGEIKEVKQAHSGDKIEIILDQSPFYGESGGQTGDTGMISNENVNIEIYDTRKYPASLIVHIGKIIEGEVSLGDIVFASVDENRRNNTAHNHTATHLLQAALRELLGEHIKQAGSYVGPERMRFDFTHFAQIPPGRLKEIELLVNRNIQKNYPVTTEIMSRDDAFKLDAVALFEERYGDNVRVVSIGDNVSRELCGGTHVSLTGDIGLFMIASEGAVSSGIRRIEAFTGEYAVRQMQNDAYKLRALSDLLRTPPESLLVKTEQIIKDQREKEREIESLKATLANRQSEELLDTAITVKDIQVISQEVKIANPKDMREFGDYLKDKLKSGIIVLGARDNGKVFLLCRITADLTNRFHAGNIIKELAGIVGGRGGGRKDMAEGGGTKQSELKRALSEVYKIIDV
jgi:alanyl-tRNA synthetase